MAKKITAWSFSRLTTWEECPRKAKYKYIDKKKEPAGKASGRGITIHTQVAAYLNRYIKKLPPELEVHTDQLAKLRRLKGLVEEQWAFTKDWKETAWFGDDAWFRAVVDFAHLNTKRLLIVDHKTGGIYPSHKDQLDLYALVGFLKNPKSTRVEVRLLYLDKLKVDERIVKRGELACLKKVWMKRVKPMLADQRFPTSPGNYCRWCHFSKAKGGPCEF